MSQSSQENLAESGSSSGSLRDSNSSGREGSPRPEPQISYLRRYQPGLRGAFVPSLSPFERFLRPIDFSSRLTSPLDSSDEEESESSSDDSESRSWIVVPSNVQDEASPVSQNPDEETQPMVTTGEAEPGHQDDDARSGIDEDYQELDIDDDIDRISDASDLDWTRGPFSYEVPFGPRIHERYRFEAEHPDMADMIRGVRNLPARGMRAVARARNFGRRVVQTYHRAARQVNQAVDASRDMAVTAGQILWGAQAATRGAIGNLWLVERWRQGVLPELLAERLGDDPIEPLMRVIDRVRMAGLRGLEG